MRSFQTALVVVAAVTLTAVPARAETATVPFSGLSVTYDTATWRVGGDGASGALVFTCIAPACIGEPSLYASASPLPATAAGGNACVELREASRDPTPPAPTTAGPVRFLAWSSWSGCRALDTPILSACALYGGKTYRFTNALISGCNRSPELSYARLVELLSAIRPAAE